MTDERVDAIRRAIRDPAAFVERNTIDERETPESLDAWQVRAVTVALDAYEREHLVPTSVAAILRRIDGHLAAAIEDGETRGQEYERWRQHTREAARTIRYALDHLSESTEQPDEIPVGIAITRAAYQCICEQEREAMERSWQQQRFHGDWGEEEAHRVGWEAARAYARREDEDARAHDYPLEGFDLSWRDGAYYVSVPGLLREGERLHVVPAQRLIDAEVENTRLRERIEELEHTVDQSNIREIIDRKNETEYEVRRLQKHLVKLQGVLLSQRCAKSIARSSSCNKLVGHSGRCAHIDPDPYSTTFA